MVDFYIVLIMVTYFRLEISEAKVNLKLGYSRETFDTEVKTVDFNLIALYLLAI